MLCSACLGTKKLSLSQHSNSEDVNHYILEAYLQLHSAGGYELLRATADHVLDVIPIPPDGYSAPYLKEVVQQAKIYIRPIQKDSPPASTVNTILGG